MADAHACRQDHAVVIAFDRRGHGFPEPGREREHFGVVRGHVGDGEFVTREAGNPAAFGERFLEPDRDPSQDVVTDEMPHEFVDDLETVQANQHHPHRVLGAGHHRRQRLLEDDAMGQPGHGVVTGRMGELGFRAQLFADITADGEGLAVGADEGIPGQPAIAAVLAAEAIGDPADPIALVAQGGDRSRAGGQIIGMDERIVAARSQLGLAESGDLGKGRVGLDDALGTDVEDAIDLERQGKKTIALVDLVDQLCTLDGDRGDGQHLVDAIELIGARFARFAVVDGEAADRLSVAAEDRRRPAGQQSMLEGDVAVARPQRIGGDIGDDDAFAAMKGGPAGSLPLADGNSVDRRVVGIRQARRRAVQDMAAIGIEQQDRAQGVGIELLVELRDQAEVFGQRVLRGDAGQHDAVAFAHAIDAAPGRDISERNAHAACRGLQGAFDPAVFGQPPGFEGQRGLAFRRDSG